MFSFSLIIGQEQKLTFKVGTNPTDLDYWWLEKNNFGVKPADFHFQGEWKFKTSKTDYVINILSQKEKNYLNESFIKHNFSDKTFLRLGKYYRDFSNYLNDELSSGHMLISHNAEPMPKIGLVTSQYIKRNQNIIFNFGVAHGIFNKHNYYTEDPFLHEKFIYIQIKKDNREMGFGLVHEAMWAGATPELGKQPSTFGDFLKILAAEDGPDEGGPHANALGNHLGIWDFYYQKTNNHQILKLYYQHFFEDTSSLRLRNEIDGLWGVELKNYIPNTNVLFEYLDTTHARMDPPYQLDYYYSNYQYVNGWTYGNNIIGSPFVNTDGSEQGFEELKVIHMGINGKIASNYYKIKISRKINIHDIVRYKIEMARKITDKVNLNIFIVNKRHDNGAGLSISYFVKH